jgi:YesN/AraC family two-component response regulator
MGTVAGQWFLGLVIVSIVTYGLSLQFPEKFPILFLTTIAFATPYIYMSTYKGITQSTLWKSKPDLSKEIVEKQIHEAEEIEVLNKKTEKRTQAVDSKFEEINTRILGLMTQEKLYQETELTLQNLADKLNFPSYQVSQAINTGMQKSFYDLVNSYRVEEAKRLLTESNSRNYTILSVGFEAGFNSKTTFNTVFKKFTGRTPTEFRDEYSRQPAT